MKCPVCGSEKSRTLIERFRRPASVCHLVTDPVESTGVVDYPIHIVMCPVCMHVYNCAFDGIKYYNGCNMYNAGAKWSQVIDDVAARVNALGPEKVVEIGAGDGSFLQKIRCKEKTAFEPCKADAVKIKGAKVISEYFDPYKYHYPCLKGSLVVMRHVLEHIQHLQSFLSRIKDAGATSLAIEVPNCENALVRGRLEDWTYEHVHHFTSNSLGTLLQITGWESGQFDTLYNGEVLFCSAYSDPVQEIMCDEYVKRFEEVQELWMPDIKKALNALRHRSGLVWWGGAGKSMMTLHNFWVPGDRVVDSDVRKVGYCVPGLPVRIEDPGTIRESNSVVLTSYWRVGDIVEEMKTRNMLNDTYKIHEGEVIPV